MEKRRSSVRKSNYKAITKKNIVIIENDENCDKGDNISNKKLENKTEDKEKDENWCAKASTVKNTSDEPDTLPTTKDDIPLQFNWVLWCHKLSSNDWSSEGFEQLYTIRTVKDFWRIFGNLHQMGMEYMHFYLMKENIEPRWEYVDNRDGGTCSIKIEFKQACSVMEDLCSHMVIHSLLVEPHSIDEVNGITFSPKINSRNSFAIVKIWNKRRNNDTSKLLNVSLLDKYSKLSIQYKQNKPEY